VAHAYHHIFPVIVDPEVAASTELIFKTKEPMTGHQKVSSILEQVKTYEITLKQGLQELKAVLEHAENA